MATAAGDPSLDNECPDVKYGDTKTSALHVLYNSGRIAYPPEVKQYIQEVWYPYGKSARPTIERMLEIMTDARMDMLTDPPGNQLIGHKKLLAKVVARIVDWAGRNCDGRQAFDGLEFDDGTKVSYGDRVAEYFIALIRNQSAAAKRPLSSASTLASSSRAQRAMPTRPIATEASSQVSVTTPSKSSAAAEASQISLTTQQPKHSVVAEPTTPSLMTQSRRLPAPGPFTAQSNLRTTSPMLRPFALETFQASPTPQPKPYTSSPIPPSRLLPLEMDGELPPLTTLQAYLRAVQDQTTSLRAKKDELEEELSRLTI